MLPVTGRKILTEQTMMSPIFAATPIVRARAISVTRSAIQTITPTQTIPAEPAVGTPGPRWKTISDHYEIISLSSIDRSSALLFRHHHHLPSSSVILTHIEGWYLSHPTYLWGTLIIMKITPKLRMIRALSRYRYTGANHVAGKWGLDIGDGNHVGCRVRMKLLLGTQNPWNIETMIFRYKCT